MRRSTREIQALFGSIRAYEDDLITQHILAFGAHTRVELAFLLSVVDVGDLVFDLGSHIGSFTLPLARRVGPRGRVLAVEAHPDNYELLLRNIGTNNLSDIVVAANRIVAPPGAYKPRETQGNTGATHFLPQGDTEGAAVASVDALCNEFFFPRVLKADIEGFEWHALSSAPSLLARRPILYLEVCSAMLERAGSSLPHVSSMLAGLSFRLFRNVGDRNAAHDNYVVAELRGLEEGGEFFDLLAVHEDDERLHRLTDRITC